jgi:hypothetical protein
MTATSLSGGLDTQKLRSSMTLCLGADPVEPVFPRVLNRYLEGRPDPATDQRHSFKP